MRCRNGKSLGKANHSNVGAIRANQGVKTTYRTYAFKCHASLRGAQAQRLLLKKHE